jgi:hypothetical protein
MPPEQTQNLGGLKKEKETAASRRRQVFLKIFYESFFFEYFHFYYL